MSWKLFSQFYSHSITPRKIKKKKKKSIKVPLHKYPPLGKRLFCSLQFWMILLCAGIQRFHSSMGRGCEGIPATAWAGKMFLSSGRGLGVLSAWRAGKVKMWELPALKSSKWNPRAYEVPVCVFQLSKNCMCFEVCHATGTPVPETHTFSNLINVRQWLAKQTKPQDCVYKTSVFGAVCLSISSLILQETASPNLSAFVLV